LPVSVVIFGFDILSMSVSTSASRVCWPSFGDMETARAPRDIGGVRRRREGRCSKELSSDRIPRWLYFTIGENVKRDNWVVKGHKSAVNVRLVSCVKRVWNLCWFTADIRASSTASSSASLFFCLGTDFFIFIFPSHFARVEEK